jgi:hypothetical protein
MMFLLDILTGNALLFVFRYCAQASVDIKRNVSSKHTPVLYLVSQPFISIIKRINCTV